MRHVETRDDATRGTVSVVIPTWNRRRELGTAIKSVLAQTYPPHEVLVCEDGNSDGSEQVVRDLDDHRVVWLPGPHAGHPGPPRNRGIKAAVGEWVAFLDDDDIWLPEKLAKQMSALERSGHLACCTNAWHETTSAAPVVYHESLDRAYTLTDTLKENRVVCSSAVVHRSILGTTEGFPEDAAIIYEDYALWLRVSCLTNFEFLGEALVRYIDDPATSARRYGAEPALQRFVILRDVRRWLKRTRGKRIAGAANTINREFRQEVLRDLRSRISRWAGRR